MGLTSGTPSRKNISGDESMFGTFTSTPGWMIRTRCAVHHSGASLAPLEDDFRPFAKEYEVDTNATA